LNQNLVTEEVNGMKTDREGKETEESNDRGLWVEA